MRSLNDSRKNLQRNSIAKVFNQFGNPDYFGQPLKDPFRAFHLRDILRAKGRDQFLSVSMVILQGRVSCKFPVFSHLILLVPLLGPPFEVRIHTPASIVSCPATIATHYRRTISAVESIGSIIFTYSICSRSDLHMLLTTNSICWDVTKRNIRNILNSVRSTRQSLPQSAIGNRQSTITSHFPPPIRSQTPPATRRTESPPAPPPTASPPSARRSGIGIPSGPSSC